MSICKGNAALKAALRIAWAGLIVATIVRTTVLRNVPGVPFLPKRSRLVNAELAVVGECPSGQLSLLMCVTVLDDIVAGVRGDLAIRQSAVPLMSSRRVQPQLPRLSW